VAGLVPVSPVVLLCAFEYRNLVGECAMPTMRVLTGLDWLIRIVLLTGVLVYLQSYGSARAQAGSTGGTIGKQNKSVSGSEEGTGRPLKSPRKANVSGCAKAIGTWGWFNGGTTIIKADGTATSEAATANWSCINGQVVITWSTGWNDRLSISADGNHLEGTNGFIRVSANRRS
jgi:hypothetical protein